MDIDLTTIVMAAKPLPTELALVEIVKRLGLPMGSKASDVIQHLITKSGHTITLLALMQVAHTLDADIQLYVTDHEAVKVPHDM